MSNILIFIIAVYFSIALGLYFKAFMFRSEVKNKEKAFVAPFYWILMIFFILLSKKWRKELLPFVVLHPYISLLSCYITLANETKVGIKSQKNTCKSIAGAYEKDLALCIA